MIDIFLKHLKHLFANKYLIVTLLLPERDRTSGINYGHRPLLNWGSNSQ